MGLNVLLLMNEEDSAVVKALLKSKIPSCEVFFDILENFISISDDTSSNTFNYNRYDLCVVKSNYVEHKLISLGAVAICWHKIEDLSLKFDVFVQLRRTLESYPLDLKDWRLTEVLHNSQDCVIYKAIDVNATPVAIKRFKFDAGQLSKDTITEFLEGASLQCSIRSNGLVRIHEGGVCNGGFYLIMEYLKLGNLRHYLDSRDNALPLKHALEWFKEIANALDIIHQAELIHRDLKIDNIILRDDGSLALTDYGVSKNILLNADFLTEEELHCSPYYVSPELISGEPCSQQSDIYSLGIIFYELLVGVRPYSANNSYDLMMAHIREPIPMLPESLQVFQPNLNNMLAKSPKDRFENTTELLRQFVSSCSNLLNTDITCNTPPHFMQLS